jgi:hypothetical protein
MTTGRQAKPEGVQPPAADSPRPASWQELGAAVRREARRLSQEAARVALRQSNARREDKQ